MMGKFRDVIGSKVTRKVEQEMNQTALKVFFLRRACQVQTVHLSYSNFCLRNQDFADLREETVRR